VIVNTPGHLIVLGDQKELKKRRYFKDHFNLDELSQSLTETG
jgi:hypothetical protein